MDTWRPLPFLTINTWITDYSRLLIALFSIKTLMKNSPQENRRDTKKSSMVILSWKQKWIIRVVTKFKPPLPFRVIHHHHRPFCVPSFELLFEFLHASSGQIKKKKNNEIRKKKSTKYNCWPGKKVLIEEVVPDTFFFANSCLLVCENYSVTE